jgi:hypothetical protein
MKIATAVNPALSRSHQPAMSEAIVAESLDKSAEPAATCLVQSGGEGHNPTEGSISGSEPR